MIGTHVTDGPDRTGGKMSRGERSYAGASSRHCHGKAASPADPCNSIGGIDATADSDLEAAVQRGAGGTTEKEAPGGTSAKEAPGSWRARSSKEEVVFPSLANLTIAHLPSLQHPHQPISLHSQ